MIYIVIRYHQLNKELSLCENFVGKTIVEYPQLIVVLGSHLSEFCLLDGLLRGENSARLRRDTKLKQEVIDTTTTTTTRQETAVEKSESDKECSEEETSALQLIARSYSDSDDNS